MEYDQPQVLVADLGSENIQFETISNQCGQMVQNPQTMASQFGRFKSIYQMSSYQTTHQYFGEMAQQKSSILDIIQPIQNQIITHWDAMQRILHHIIYDQLNIDPSEIAVLFTETQYNPKNCRQKLVNMAFETFNVNHCSLQQENTLTLRSVGLQTGVVLNCSHGITDVTSIYEGYGLENSYQYQDIGGEFVNDYLKYQLSQVNFRPSSKSEHLLVQKIKEKCCYFSNNRMKQQREVQEAGFELPDGTYIGIGDISFRAPECLFNPLEFHQDVPGIQELFYQSIMSTDIDLRRQLFENTIITGGTSQFKGFDKRFQLEVDDLIYKNNQFNLQTNIKENNSREHSSWIGGRIVSSLSSFFDEAISKSQYEEYGPSIVHRKCF